MQREAIDTTPELRAHFNEAAASAISADTDTEQKTGATKTTHTTPSMVQLLGQEHEKLFGQKLLENLERLDKNFERLDNKFEQLDTKFERLETSVARIEAEMKALRGPSQGPSK